MRLSMYFLMIAGFLGLSEIALSARLQSDNSVVSDLQTKQATYFNSKIENLTEKLSLSPDQQKQLRPIVEQEMGNLEQIRGNPVLSKKEKVKRLQEIVRESDTRMKSFLSPDQWQKLQALRKSQKAELDQYARAK